MRVCVLLTLFRRFRVVAEAGSVIRGAKVLGIAQPALTRSIHALERRAGSALMERGPRGVRLTPAGTELLQATDTLFDQVEETMRLVRLTGAGKAGTLRMGLTRAALDNRRIGRGLATLQQHAPDLRVVVSEVDTVQQGEHLRTGGLDLGIGYIGFADDGLRSVALCDVQIDGVVLSEFHPLASEKSIDVHQLSDDRLLLVDPLGPLPTHLLDSLRAAGVREYEFRRTLASVFSLVAAGRGWTMMPGSGEASAPMGTVIVPLRGFSFTLTLGAKSPRDDTSPLAQHAAALLCRAVNDDLVAGPPGASVQDHRRPVDLSLRHLRSFLATAEAGSVSLASGRLGLTQSGLSRQLRSFERDLGTVLFRRRLHGVELTPAGDLLHTHAPRLLSLADSALARGATQGRGITGSCTIGALATAFTGHLIRDAIRGVAVRHPEVSIEVVEMLSLAQVADLNAHRIDLGFAAAHIPLPDVQDLEDLLVLEDPIESALVSASSPLAKRRLLRPEDLSHLPFRFIEREVNPAFYDLVIERLTALGASPRQVGAYNGMRAIWRAVADQGGWTLGSRSLGARPFEGVVAVPVKGLHLRWGIRLLWRRDEFDPAVVAVRAAFKDLVFSAA
jgi:DNA-binding transcriptional LysR family regulator